MIHCILLYIPITLINRITTLSGPSGFVWFAVGDGFVVVVMITQGKAPVVTPESGQQDQGDVANKSIQLVTGAESKAPVPVDEQSAASAVVAGKAPRPSSLQVQFNIICLWHEEFLEIFY